MPRYLIQAAYTAEATAAFARNPQDRAPGVKKLAESLGGKLESIYFCLGDFDVMAIYEAPDDATAAAVSLAASSPGHLKTFKTTKLLTSDEFMEAQRKAHNVEYRGPSGD